MKMTIIDKVHNFLDSPVSSRTFWTTIVVVILLGAFIICILPYPPQTREEHAVYHRQGIIQTDNGDFWEVDCDLIPASEYIVTINDNGTRKDITDDYIEHLVQCIF